MPDTNTIDASVKKLEAITKERFAKLTDVDKDNYLKEINEFSKCFDEYFNKSTEYTNSRMNYAFAIMALEKYEKQNISVDKSNFVNLSLAKDILEKDISNENKIPYVNGTQNCIDTLKGLDIGLKYGVIPPSILKEELNKWHDVIIKNVDFQKVENAIETKELLNSIDFRNCKFVNCKTDDLEHLNFSKESNSFIKTGRTAKAPDIFKKFEKPKERNWKYQVDRRTKILDPRFFHSNSGDKIKLNIPSKEGIYEWYFPKDWVRPAYDGLFLAIPKDVKLGDIICKEPNSNKPLPAKTLDLLKSTNVIACGSRHFSGYKFYNVLMDEKFLNYETSLKQQRQEALAKEAKKTFNDFFYDFDFSIRGKDVSLKFEGYDNGAIIKASVFDMKAYEAKEPSVIFKNVKNIDDLLKSMAEYNENLELATALHKCASSLRFVIPMKAVSDLEKDLNNLSNENKEKQTSSSKPLSPKGFHDFMKENEKQTKKVSLKTKPQTKENDIDNDLGNSK